MEKLGDKFIHMDNAIINKETIAYALMYETHTGHTRIDITFANGHEVSFNAEATQGQIKNLFR